MHPRALLRPLSGSELREVITPEDARRQIGLPEDDESCDGELLPWISVASQLMAGDGGLGRPFWRVQYEERLPGSGGDQLILGRWPVESVAEVRHRGELLEPGSYEIAGDRRQVLFRSSGWACSPRPRHVDNTATGGEPLDYTVVYTAGWLLPGEEAEGAIPLPADLKLAAQLIVGDGFNGEHQIPGGVKRERIGDMSWEYRDQVDLIPPASRAALRSYR